MFILFSSIIAPTVVGCAIVWLKHKLASRGREK